MKMLTDEAIAAYCAGTCGEEFDRRLTEYLRGRSSRDLIAFAQSAEPVDEFNLEAVREECWRRAGMTEEMLAAEFDPKKAAAVWANITDILLAEAE